MERYKLVLSSVIILILTLKSGSTERIKTPCELHNEGEEVASRKHTEEEDLTGKVMIVAYSPDFHRVIKVESISPALAKAGTLDIFPKVSISDDKNVFWEVTRVPDRKLNDKVKLTDFFKIRYSQRDEIPTPDMFDSAIEYSKTPGKRVKKVLPPYIPEIDGPNSRTTEIQSAPNISETKITAIKASDLREINHRDKKPNSSDAEGVGNNRSNLTDSKGKNSTQNTDQIPLIKTGIYIKENQTAEAVNASESAEEIGEEIAQMESVAREHEEEEIGTTAGYNAEIYNSSLSDISKALEIVNATPQAAEGDLSILKRSRRSQNANEIVKRKIFVAVHGDAKTRRNNSLALSLSATTEKAFAPVSNKAVMDIASKTFTISVQTKDVDVAPEWKKSETTPLTDVERNSTESYLITGEMRKGKDLKIRNPEFLATPESKEPDLDKLRNFELTTAFRDSEMRKDRNEGEIHGIPLVPNEFGKSKMEEESAREKTIWDLLKERERDIAGDKGGFNEFPTKITPPKTKPTKTTLYKNFDAESAEVEYETENFRQGFSNIEKHELPFSYALPWLEIKDKGFQRSSKKEKQGDGKKSTSHSKINDFPSLLPMNKKHQQKKNELGIPHELSKLLKISQNENSVNGVTVSIVVSGTNHEDLSHYGHRPSKWYLLLLTGNSTIVKLRRKDFTKYLKLNLAARLSVEYDDIKVNKVILAPPKVLVNISIYVPSEDIAEESQLDLKQKYEDKGESPLYKLAEANATLLELSGEEYHIVRFLSLQSQQPEAEAQKDSVPDSVSLAIRHNDIEFIVYTFVGSACACAVILALFISLSKYFKKFSEHRWPWKKSKEVVDKLSYRIDANQDEFNGISPAVIYSGGFPQIRGSWMSGIGSRGHPPVGCPERASSILKRYPGIEIGTTPTQHKNTSLYPEIENRTCNSPRHNKLQIYSAGANNLVLPVPPQRAAERRKLAKGDAGDEHPLDVRIPTASHGEDDTNFSR